MMRIAIDYTSAVQQHAGIGRYTRELIRALAQLDHDSRYTLFSAGHDPEGYAWPSNFRTRELPLTDRHLAILWQRLRLPLPVEFITGGADIYHSPDFVLAPVLHAKRVLTIHDLSFMRLPECSSPPLLEYLMRNVPRSIERADLILADSESTQQDLVELLHVDPAQTRVVYAGIDPNFGEHLDVDTARKKYGLQRPYILSVGTLQPRKNYVRLIKAFALLRQEQQVDIDLVIAGGNGWLYEEIFETITELGLEERVHVTGFVDEADLPSLYAGAAVFAFPTLYEGFGMPVLEALACGAPVLTANTSSLPEAAGEAALLVDPLNIEGMAEGLWRLLDERELRNELMSHAEEQLAKFTWPHAAADLLASYKSL